ncbi:hypothetical protein [Microcoleus sp. OTE_8_concoct_300]|uniref:hypothetical protein n=1 Tax=Microcoleus sp. OTE_8_concoct_300 TaxID=2964710 RepID=UPI00403EF745
MPWGARGDRILRGLIKNWYKKIDKFWYAAILSAAVVWLKERNYVPNLSRQAASVFGEKETFDLRVEKPIFEQKLQ